VVVSKRVVATLAGARDAREDVDGKDDTPSGDVLGLWTQGGGERIGKRRTRA
jgi:hypothetical protein